MPFFISFIEQKPCTNHFVLMKCAHHFLLTLFEWYLPLGFWWSKIQFHFRKFIVVHCLVKVRAFPHRLNLCSNKILWMVGSLFQLFPLFRMLFCEQILWYNNKIAHSGVHLFSGNFSRSTQTDTPSNHTIARFIAGAHTKQQYYKVSIIDILTVYVYIFRAYIHRKHPRIQNEKRCFEVRNVW